MSFWILFKKSKKQYRAPAFEKQNAITTYQNAIMALAENKIGRPLTEVEINGIRNIHSIMMLEVIEVE